jgi:hypothetical protein
MRMDVQATDLDGRPIGMVELVKHADGRLFAANQPVVAQQVIGSRIALLIPGRHICVTLADYWRVMRSGDAAGDT